MNPSRHFWIPAFLALIFAFFLSACREKNAPEIEKKTNTVDSVDSVPVPAEIWKEFSGEKALAHALAQCEIGPRPAGSPELNQTRRLIIAELERNGWSVELQFFVNDTPRGPFTFINLIARFGSVAEGRKTARFLVASHYDTKIFDTIRFVGANDGASSTGALMELSRVLALEPVLARQVELVFFDGEEAFKQFSETDGLYGSRYYARNLRETGRDKQFKAGVLWDMIGKKDTKITLAPDSPQQLTQQFLAAADALNLRSALTFYNRSILDDHTPLNQVGIPTIDLIDFNYVYWHTADDTPDKLSAESLQTIGSLTLRWLKTAAEGK